MTGLLWIFGSFTGIFSDRVSHDMSYLEPISEKINLDIPTDGYISIMYDFQDSGDSLAMVKIDDQNDSFTSKLDNNNNWKKDTSFIPSNKIDLYLLTMTSSYDYFMVYNLTSNSLSIGQVLKIPSKVGTTYIVKSGDSLYAIARKSI